MLLTLAPSCIRPLIGLTGKTKKPKIDLLDLPVYVRDHLQLSGLNLSTDLLAGADRKRLDMIRDRCDRASCACLLLQEQEQQALGGTTETSATPGITRLIKVVEAAQIIGCSAVAVSINAPDTDEALVLVAKRLRKVMERAEKLDINLVISPTKGLTYRPERVTELLKKVGGFRIGTYPDFQAAAESADPQGYLHRLTPYATVVSASSVQFVPSEGKGARGKAGTMTHKPYSLKQMIESILSVGYDGPLAIDYRGTGDMAAGLINCRDAIRECLVEPVEGEVDLMEGGADDLADEQEALDQDEE